MAFEKAAGIDRARRPSMEQAQRWLTIPRWESQLPGEELRVESPVRQKASALFTEQLHLPKKVGELLVWSPFSQ